MSERECTKMDLIVAANKGIEVECLYYGYKKENLVSNVKTLQFGDVLTISNKGKYVVDVGWFVLITVNHSIKEYVSALDLEASISIENIMSPIDCMLEQFHISYQLDKALESRDKQKFIHFSEKKKELFFLYDRISSKEKVAS